MATRIYKTIQGDTVRLVRANTPATARSFVAKDTIQVSVASPDDTYELATKGVKVEDTTDAPAQLEIGE
jgi:hypothetical protein